ncbi:hypothetical protein NIG5292_02895 [Nereida ignava]|uniref:Uncharacterized protein n=1 Tax=Nereida ignava TaxID=282199 RepID=A0A0U1NQ52_9RHOB|nr:hypothetical protein NIG5292_02895 [Nereida ignava]
MTTSLIIKPEQKRLNRSIHTGVGQTNIRINLAPETGNRAQFARQMPEQRHHGCKRLDRSAEQRQGGREDVLLGECQLKQSYRLMDIRFMLLTPLVLTLNLYQD